MNSFVLSTNPRSSMMLAIGLDIGAKATLMVLAAFVLHVILRSSRTLARSATWNACLAGLLVLPVAVLALPQIPIPGLPAMHSAASEARVTELGSVHIGSAQLGRAIERVDVITESDTESTASADVAIPMPSTHVKQAFAAEPAKREINPIASFFLFYVVICVVLAARLLAAIFGRGGSFGRASL